MSYLSAESMAAWREKLPDDIRAAVPDDLGGDEQALAALAGRLSSASPEAIVGIIGEQADDFISMGSARRMRFLAWLARRTSPESGSVFRQIAEERDGEDGKGAGKVAPYFLSDLKALATALSPRVLRQMMTPGNIDPVLRASWEVQGEMQMRQEGGL